MTEIKKSAQVGTVRKELSSFTRNPKWLDDRYWDFFRKRRGIILNRILASYNVEHLDYPETTREVDQKFIEDAKIEFGVPEGEWVLVGDWFRRTDIVSWMKWNHLKNREKPVSKVPSRGAGESSSASAHAVGDNGVSASTSAGLGIGADVIGDASRSGTKDGMEDRVNTSSTDKQTWWDPVRGR